MAWTLPSLAALGRADFPYLPSKPSYFPVPLSTTPSELHFRVSCLIVTGFHSKLPFIPAPSTLASLALPNLGTVGH